MRLYLLTLLLSFSLSACFQRPPTKNTSAIFTISKRPPVKVDQAKTPYTFGYLEVPENRQNPTGRTIKLPVYIFKSRSDNPAPDPVLYTVGGPGNTSMNAAPYMRSFQYLDDRDLILFEQRGTYHAQPGLDCPEWEEASKLVNQRSFSEEARATILEGAAAGCSERLKKRGIDLNAYNTREIAADIEDLRKVLEIEQFNLLTISYSTKIAQVMMREYPKSIRSVVMDSPLPLAASWDETSITNLMETYDIVFKDCAADSLCNNKYPDLRQRFYNFLEATASEPISLTVKHPNNNSDTTVTIGSVEIAGYLGDLYTGVAPAFPKLLDAVIKGDKEVLRQRFSWAHSSGNGIGMRLSVWCGEETAYASPEKVTAESKKYPFLAGASPMVFSFELCHAWGVKPALPIENQAISSNIPTLLISGTFDAITPRWWADTLHAQLVNSQQVIYPGWTHGPTTYWSDDCAMQAARSFFNDPDKTPGPSCLEEIKIEYE